MSSSKSSSGKSSEVYEHEQLDSQKQNHSPIGNPFRPNLPPRHNSCIPFIVGLLIIFAIIVGTIIAFASGADKFKNPESVSRFVVKARDGIAIRGHNPVVNSPNSDHPGTGVAPEGGNESLLNVTGDRGFRWGRGGGGGSGATIAVPGAAVFVAIAMFYFSLDQD